MSEQPTTIRLDGETVLPPLGERVIIPGFEPPVVEDTAEEDSAWMRRAFAVGTEDWA